EGSGMGMAFSKRALIGSRALTAFVGLWLIASACAPENSFRLKQAEEQFGLVRELNTQVDILWVVDNSSSMEPSQEKLRRGFGAVARKYMRPDWDIRTAVITTDTYLANPAFKAALDRPDPASVGYESRYLGKKLDRGITPHEMNPAIGPSYSRLLQG